jgi:hypothetical protein
VVGRTASSSRATSRRGRLEALPRDAAAEGAPSRDAAARGVRGSAWLEPPGRRRIPIHAAEVALAAGNPSARNFFF